MLAVRTATVEDWPAILGMVKSYAALAPVARLDVDTTREQVSRLIVDGTAIIATVDEKPAGVCLMGIGPHVFSKDLMAQEVMWWVNPEHRRSGVGSALVAFAEELAVDRGAVGLLMHSFSYGTQDAADAAFAGMGFGRLQTGWFKELA